MRSELEPRGEVLEKFVAYIGRKSHPARGWKQNCKQNSNVCEDNSHRFIKLIHFTAKAMAFFFFFFFFFWEICELVTYCGCVRLVGIFFHNTCPLKTSYQGLSLEAAGGKTGLAAVFVQSVSGSLLHLETCSGRVILIPSQEVCCLRAPRLASLLAPLQQAGCSAHGDTTAGSTGLDDNV